MGLIRWSNKQQGEGRSHEISPFAEAQAEFGRMFDMFRDNPVGFMARPFTGGMMPTVDVSEKDDAVIVRAELPGVEPDNIDLTLAENTLTISGEKSETKEETEGEVYRKESRHGSFRRTIALPSEIESDSADAEFKHGVLTVRMKKQAGAARKKINIRSGE